MRRHHPSCRFKSNINIEYYSFFVSRSLAFALAKTKTIPRETEKDKEMTSEMKKITNLPEITNHTNTHTRRRHRLKNKEQRNTVRYIHACQTKKLKIREKKQKTDSIVHTGHASHEPKFGREMTKGE